jgi:hypothetical protein
MARPRTLLVGLVALAVLPLTLTAAAGTKCTSQAPPPLAFSEPDYISTDKAGGEPVSVVAQDGAIVVSAHAGTTHVYKDPNALPGAENFVVGYTNQTLHWRSADGGKTWQYVGLFGMQTGPHTVTSTGFSDPDLTMDAGGRIYDTEIDLVNVSVFSSTDDGRSFFYGNPEASSGDRPWLTGAEAEEVFLYVNLPRQLWRSTNGGLTFSLVSTDFPASGKLVVDPLNPAHGLIGPSVDSDGFGIAISPDDGVTWKRYPVKLGKSTQFFGTVAVDRAGNVYVAAAGGYLGATDRKADGEVTFASFDRKTKKWSPVTKIPIPAGDALWPWLAAGDDGRVAVVWYQSMAKNPDAFYIMAAETLNGHGTKCSDGRWLPPRFRVVNASGRPIHLGQICLDGTACNADSDFAAGDRRLGDFFTVNYDHSGRIFIVSADTRLTNFQGGPKPVANPIFIAQTEGTKLLKRPIPNT